jgi:dTDP-4-dehydrorhamnose reductase
MRRVAVIGANGQLGLDVCQAFASAGYDVAALNHAELEVADRAAVDAVLTPLAPAVIVNTAAMHNVDACEADPARAFAVNGIGARNIAQAATALGAVVVHVSTDYVFDGATRRPYVEEDAPRPLNVYGITKLAGEYAVRVAGPRHAVVRSSGLYGTGACRAKGGLNFVRLMLKLARERGEVRVVTDEMVTPTYTRDLAAQLVPIAEGTLGGVVHATCQGACSWNEFAAAIFELAGQPVRLLAATSADFPAKVPRPTYSVLDNARLRAAGVDRMPPWRESLRRYLAEIGELRAA